MANFQLPPQAMLWKAGRLQREAERARNSGNFGEMYIKGFEAAFLRQEASRAREEAAKRRG